MNKNEPKQPTIEIYTVNIKCPNCLDYLSKDGGIDFTFAEVIEMADYCRTHPPGIGCTGCGQALKIPVISEIIVTGDPK